MTCKGTLFSSNRALCVEKKCEEFSELTAKVHTTTLRSLGLVRHPPKASGFFATPWRKFATPWQKFATPSRKNNKWWQPLNNHWTTNEQPLNNHWTNHVQTMFKPCSNHVQTKTLLSGKVLFFSAKLPPDNNRYIGTRLGTTLYVN